MRGNRRPIPNLTSADGRARSAAERAALNSIPQGSAADVVKSAMARFQRRSGATLPSCRLVLQVHDELVFEAPIEAQDAVRRPVRALWDMDLGLCDGVAFVFESYGAN